MPGAALSVVTDRATVLRVSVMAELVGAIDQGTTSTRFMVFDAGGRLVAAAQREHAQLLPRPGWVEHDADEIWDCTRAVVAAALADARLGPADLAAVGITNQRETTVVWDRRTGRPLANAVVWQDTRSDRIVAALHADGRADLVHERTGLPPATYFSAGKLQWLLESVDGVRAAAARGEAAFGTVDSWLLWRLTEGGVHATDVTNASRTMLMDLDTLEWDDELLEVFGVPHSLLPAIEPSLPAQPFGETRAFGDPLAVAAVLGDQQAATVGQVCFAAGEAKNTYGTGNFLLLNTGRDSARSRSGLLTTVLYALGEEPPVYALEGSIAVTGSAVAWLRDGLGVIGSAAESEALARQVPDSGGVYFVPAFSGLYAPYWRPDARGAVVGLSRHSTKAHLARATLESIAYQTKDVVDVMVADAGVSLEVLKVDGGATVNDLLLQLQADILGVPVSRPAFRETTALGAAYAAGLAVGVWRDVDDLRGHWVEERRFEPTWTDERRAEGYAAWRKAVERSLGWVELD
jgi:glycerol kinase